GPALRRGRLRQFRRVRRFVLEGVAIVARRDEECRPTVVAAAVVTGVVIAGAVADPVAVLADAEPRPAEVAEAKVLGVVEAQPLRRGVPPRRISCRRSVAADLAARVCAARNGQA